jgi:SAM-dependent methyltransferase
LADGSVDTVVATLVLCSVDDVARTLAEVRRVLRPGGSLRLLEHERAEGRWGGVQDGLQPLYGRLAGGCHWNRRLEDDLRDSGFRLEVEQRLRYGPLFPVFRGIAYPEASAA